jgi:acyl-CoA synthetase (NDP forming)
VSEHPLDRIFHPRAIALVGVSTNQASRGTDFLNALLDQKYEEHRPLYLVNPKATEIRGLKVYPSLLDCPSPVDHVISLIPRAIVGQLVDQCVQKGVRSLHFFTAGFSESGEAGMAEAEQELAARARAGGVRVLGPNCMGLYVPEERIAFSTGFPRETGNMMGISQSGANAMDIIMGLGERGARFSKVVSFGNGSDIAAPELFDYAASDPDTEVVVAYIEGVRDGRAFFEAVKRCAAAKPTIILKGGFTAAGARAANSHTGSLAGSAEVFEALCRQTGAIRADTMEELHDLAIAVSTGVRNVRGRRSVLVGGGGGFSVLSADAIAKHDIDLPELPDETKEQLREYVPVAGNSIRNPIDAGFIGDNRRETLERVTEIAANAPGYDFVFVSTGNLASPRASGIPDPNAQPDDSFDADPAMDGAPGGGSKRERAAATADFLADLQERSGAPMVVVRRGHEFDPESAIAFQQEAYVRNLGSFFTVPRAARTVDLLLEWRERREGLPEIF